MRPTLAVMALLAVLVLSACGGGDPGEPSDGGSAATSPAAPAPAGLQIGIGEQGLKMFGDPLFKELGVTKARLVTAYDTTRVRFERDIVDQWLAGAAQAGVEPFITFGHSRVNPKKLPTAAEFRSSFKAFQKRWPQVKVYAPWNEINHASQPTSRSPARAAQYYDVLTEECPDCTVLAGDVLDQAGMGRYLEAYRSALKSEPKIWGLHNYADTNRSRETGLGELLDTVPGDVWLTETGGIVKFGRNFPRDEQRAARAVSFALRLARKNERVKRIYLYNWTGAKPSDRFDSGLVGPDGKPRPGYERLKAALNG